MRRGDSEHSLPGQKHPANWVPRKILVVQLKRIGDLIVTSPALRALAEHLPQAEVTVLCDTIPGGLLPALPCARGLARGQKGFWPSTLERGWDVCLDFTGTDRSALIAALSRARLRSTFARFRRRPLRSQIYNSFVESSVRDRHTADHYMDLLQAVGVTQQPALPGLSLPVESCSRARELLTRAGVRGSYAVIHPGTARPEKAWAAAHWAEVARQLEDQGLHVVLTGADTPDERLQVAEVAKRCTSAVDLAGRTSLLELAVLIRESVVFVGVDSAAMHLADAVGTKTLALFGPTNPFHWRPRNTHAEILRSGCTETAWSPYQKGSPMAELDSPRVIEALQRLLQSTKSHS